MTHLGFDQPIPGQNFYVPKGHAPLGAEALNKQITSQVPRYRNQPATQSQAQALSRAFGVPLGGQQQVQRPIQQQAPQFGIPAQQAPQQLPPNFVGGGNLGTQPNNFFGGGGVGPTGLGVQPQQNLQIPSNVFGLPAFDTLTGAPASSGPASFFSGAPQRPQVQQRPLTQTSSPNNFFGGGGIGQPTLGLQPQGVLTNDRMTSGGSLNQFQNATRGTGQVPASFGNGLSNFGGLAGQGGGPGLLNTSSNRDFFAGSRPQQATFGLPAFDSLTGAPASPGGLSGLNPQENPQFFNGIFGFGF